VIIIKRLFKNMSNIVRFLIVAGAPASLAHDRTQGL
jgi:hypothetical protein